jgi:hypothetical protein
MFIENKFNSSLWDIIIINYDFGILKCFKLYVICSEKLQCKLHWYARLLSSDACNLVFNLC